MENFFCHEDHKIDSTNHQHITYVNNYIIK
jgi:hypothetical protein